MPTYPQWKPGDPRPSDKLLILEDTDGDGRADKCTTFYDKLSGPNGFEFWNGGVLVVDQPRLIWLKDTDGDDRADVVNHLSDGWATDDTHHTIGAFEYSHGGLLHIGMNMFAMRALAPAVAELFGPGRMAIIYTLGGVAGFTLSSVAGAYIPALPFLRGGQFTVGARGTYNIAANNSAFDNLTPDNGSASTWAGLAQVGGSF